MKNRIPILLYHRITEDVVPQFRRWAVAPAVFARHMHYLASHDYTPITISHMVDAVLNPTTILPEKPVVITFDDAFCDFYANALPIVQRYQFSATLFVPTAFVGRTSEWLVNENSADCPMLDETQIAEISQLHTIELGSHSHTHAELDTLTLAEVAHELGVSKKRLTEITGKPPQSFAYPYGYFSPQVRQLVIETGYTSACAVRYALSSTQDDRFAFARLLVEDIPVEYFAELLAGNYQLWYPYERFRSLVWRMVRRTQHRIKQSSRWRSAGFLL